ncbi:MAG: ATP-dependent Clp protease adaptor ClpS [Flavobacteriaceae bacterium]|nr:ATP-dependent Clp protease adaptor ClpS [Flavobacteriaceae bacterium]MCY4267977.1 ATP-dependent Clp protease adaptor ClpS [Flavobacteriaceae bacterium]MCY4299884.1 ATP-dependent Clp protease adaptor ClpS [Flavobacteriaceae bacterium]
MSTVKLPEEIKLEQNVITDKLSLILYNDDFNTFDHVIHCLIQYCHHSQIQAEQCTLIVHYNGKCDVKSGTLEQLKTIKNQLTDEGLTAEIA